MTDDQLERLNDYKALLSTPDPPDLVGRGYRVIYPQPDLWTLAWRLGWYGLQRWR